ncbi:hypothetical protein CXG81DRAFT_19039 [Caulochytrium protostelioides]|uniref:Uncharacterized protein n=1 Tax=Caulochytrium protostelioides TaxID=1555241 RepID=A0A4P9X7B8_9FUNG|nr:hypothetical protein CXG81DRAFT_19039 [Caulochytrium protostelioides]|eukprot:RKP01126.1 hypothetical protein CXG81DRAFT_19039 [Caulochytrium protostelioides]
MPVSMLCLQDGPRVPAAAATAAAAPFAPAALAPSPSPPASRPYLKGWLADQNQLWGMIAQAEASPISEASGMPPSLMPTLTPPPTPRRELGRSASGSAAYSSPSVVSGFSVASASSCPSPSPSPSVSSSVSPSFMTSSSGGPSRPVTQGPSSSMASSSSPYRPPPSPYPLAQALDLGSTTKQYHRRSSLLHGHVFPFDAYQRLRDHASSALPSTVTDASAASDEPRWIAELAALARHLQTWRQQQQEQQEQEQSRRHVYRQQQLQHASKYGEASAFTGSPLPTPASSRATSPQRAAAGLIEEATPRSRAGLPLVPITPGALSASPASARKASLTPSTGSLFSLSSYRSLVPDPSAASLRGSLRSRPATAPTSPRQPHSLPRSMPARHHPRRHGSSFCGHGHGHGADAHSLPRQMWPGMEEGESGTTDDDSGFGDGATLRSRGDLSTHGASLAAYGKSGGSGASSLMGATMVVTPSAPKPALRTYAVPRSRDYPCAGTCHPVPLAHGLTCTCPPPKLPACLVTPDAFRPAYHDQRSGASVAEVLARQRQRRLQEQQARQAMETGIHPPDATAVASASVSASASAPTTKAATSTTSAAAAAPWVPHDATTVSAVSADFSASPGDHDGLGSDGRPVDRFRDGGCVGERHASGDSVSMARSEASRAQDAAANAVAVATRRPSDASGGAGESGGDGVAVSAPRQPSGWRHARSLMKQRSQRLLKGTPGTSSASGGSAVSALDLDVRSLGKDAVLEMPPAASRLPRPPLPRNSYSDDSATRSAVWYQAQAARATRAASIASQHSRNGCHSPASVVASQHPIHLSATAVATATLATATVATVASSTDDAIDRLLSESDHETSGRRCRDPARRVSKPGLAGDPLFDLLERLPARLADQRAVLPPPRRGAAPLRATLAPTADVLDADDLLRVYESATKDKDKDKDKASSASSRRFSLLSVALSTVRHSTDSGPATSTSLEAVLERPSAPVRAASASASTSQLSLPLTAMSMAPMSMPTTCNVLSCPAPAGGRASRDTSGPGGLVDGLTRDRRGGGADRTAAGDADAASQRRSASASPGLGVGSGMRRLKQRLLKRQPSDGPGGVSAVASATRVPGMAEADDAVANPAWPSCLPSLVGTCVSTSAETTASSVPQGVLAASSWPLQPELKVATDGVDG